MFTDGESTDHPVPPFEPYLAPFIPDSAVPHISLTITMEEAENAILDKIDMLTTLMGNFDVVDVNRVSIKNFESKLARIEDVLVETINDIRKLIRTYSNKGMDSTRSQYWSGQMSGFNLMLETTETKSKPRYLKYKILLLMMQAMPIM